MKPDSSYAYSAVAGDEVLDLRNLHPGDIILSRPAGLESALIAFFGASEFSHAQLVVPDDVLAADATASRRVAAGQVWNLVIEATTDVSPVTKQLVGGVGYYRLPRRFLRDRGAESLPEGGISPLTGYVYFEVFRHHAADTAAFQEFFHQGVQAACQRYLHEPYASVHDLAAVSVAPWTVEFVTRLLKAIPESPRSGLFCSQLVATIFRDGGFALTDSDPKHVRPGDIARSAQSGELLRITEHTRRRVRPNQEVIDLAQAISTVVPDLLNQVARDSGGTLDEVVRAIEPADTEAQDFRGRLTAWALRDRREIAMQQVRDLLGSLDHVATLAQALVQQVERQAQDDKTPAAGGKNNT